MNRTLKRQARPLLCCVLTVAMLLALSACGGSSGGGGGGGGSGSSNSRTATNANGSTTIEVDNLELTVGSTDNSKTDFTVTVKTPSGAPYANTEVVITTGAGLRVLVPEGGNGRTNANGVLEGTIEGIGGGSFQVAAQPIVDRVMTQLNPPVVTANILVFGTPAVTVTPTNNPTSGANPTSTPTAVPVVDVRKLVVQVNPFVIKSALGGDVTVTVLAFDENNVGVPGVRLLLDAQPRGGTTFDPLTPTTNSSGIAVSSLHIEPGAEVGDITVSASAANVNDSTTIQVVSGVSERPVATVVLESDQPVIGTDSGGTASLKARVFDADNIGIPNVNVLFTTEIGQVTPPVEISCGGTLNPCPPTDTGLAQTTLTVPPNAVVREYRLTANAGGITGTTNISVVAGRGGTGTGNPNAAAGEPSSVTLGASPTAIQVTGTGGAEQATIIARVFDNNNNPLSAHVVALRVVPDSATGAHMLPLSGTQPPRPEKCLEDPARQKAFEDGHLALGVTDRAGFVLASVRSGTLKGTVTIEACADSKNADDTVTTVVAQQAVLSVAAGPPALVTVAMNRNFVDNNDGTLLTTVAALVKDANGNTVEDNTAVTFSITNRQDVSIVGGSTTNNLPNCDTSQFSGQTGIPITAQPGTAITCIVYPFAQAGTVATLLAESAGVTNEDNQIEDEDFNLPPGAITGPASELPSARNFSLASQFLNLSGRVRFGLQSAITAFVGDRFGNPVKRTTSVGFVTDGGGITSQGLTSLLGRATATLTTQGTVPDDGHVTITATTEGEEDFVDVNGNGVFDPDVDIFDPAVHDQDGNGVWSADTMIHSQIRIIFSGSTVIDVEPRSFNLQAGEVQCFDVFVSDDVGNPIVGGSTVSAQVTTGLTLLGGQMSAVPDSNRSCSEAPGACTFQFCVFSSEPVTAPTVAGVTFNVTSADLGGGGNGSASTSAVGTLLPPPPTPTAVPAP